MNLRGSCALLNQLDTLDNILKQYKRIVHVYVKEIVHILEIFLSH